MGFKQFITHNLRLINNNLFVNKYRCANPVFEFHNTGFIQKEIRNQVELPLRPKKPVPPFFQFLKKKKTEVLEKQDLKYKDTVRVLSEMWKTFDVDSKTKMNDVFTKELEQYRENVRIYKENLTDDQKSLLFQMKYVQQEIKTKRKLKKELKELGKPRKPPTAYLIFITEEMQNRGNMTAQVYMSMAANKWNEMDMDSKKKYIDAANGESDKYQDLLLKWEDDMIKAGRFDLVRAHSLSTENDK